MTGLRWWFVGRSSTERLARRVAECYERSGFRTRTQQIDGSFEVYRTVRIVRPQVLVGRLVDAIGGRRGRVLRIHGRHAMLAVGIAGIPKRVPLSDVLGVVHGSGRRLA